MTREENTVKYIGVMIIGNNLSSILPFYEVTVCYNIYKLL